MKYKSIINGDDNVRAVIRQLRAGGTTTLCSRTKHVNSQEPGGGTFFSFDRVVKILVF